MFAKLQRSVLVWSFVLVTIARVVPCREAGGAVVPVGDSQSVIPRTPTGRRARSTTTPSTRQPTAVGCGDRAFRPASWGGR